MLAAMRPGLFALASCAAACGAAQSPRRPPEGSIAGLARDRDSGEVIPHADVHVRAEGDLTHERATLTRRSGEYELDHLPPGRYTVTAELAGEPIDVEHVVVRAGETTMVDLTFTLGHPEPERYDFGDARDGQIAQFHSPHVPPGAAVIAGSVSDQATRAAVAGAAVTATGPGGTEEAVTDDTGHYEFAHMRPGAYTVSAYYSIGGRGQIEVRRSAIDVPGGGGVIVPLWVELEKQ